MSVHKEANELKKISNLDDQLIHDWVKRQPPYRRRIEWGVAKQFQLFIAKPLAEVSVADIQAFATNQRLQQVSPLIIARNLMAVKSLMTFGYQGGKIPPNICPQDWEILGIKKRALAMKFLRYRSNFKLGMVVLGLGSLILIITQIQANQPVYSLVKRWETPALPQDLDGYAQSETLKNANVRAFLDMLAQAEGTSGADGYRMIFAGETFDDYSIHPDQVKCAYSNGSRLCSSAAGRYQFLKPTFDRLQRKLSLPDFSPKSQDLAAIELIREEDALDDIKNGNIREALKKVAPIWVHIEGAGYGQPEYPFEKLEKIYQKQRQKYE